MNNPLILCAVSGGADSMCMLHLLWSKGENVAVAHFNHGMRGETADNDEAFVKRFCLEKDIPFYAGRGAVYDEAEKSGEGVEVCGRRLRYAFFDQIAKQIGADFIATAHNADDQSETILMRMLRGTGSLGLSGIPKARDNIIRPILDMSRADIEDYMRQNGLDYIYDCTNSDDRYVRNLLRHKVMPVLKEVNPNLNNTLARCARLATEDEDFLKKLAADFLDKHGEKCSVNAEALSKLVFPVSSRVLRIMAEHACLSLTETQVRAALDLASDSDPSASIDVKGGAVWRCYDKLFIGVPLSGSLPGETPVIVLGETPIPGIDIKIILKKTQNSENVQNSFNTFYLNNSIIDSRITVRSRKTGDKIRLPGRSHRSLKKLMCDMKLPAPARDLIPVITVDGAVAAVMGIGVDERFMPRPGEDALELHFCETAVQGGTYGG